MDIKFVTTKETKEVETNKKVYIAFDGKEFSNRDDCMEYEYALKEDTLSSVEQCKAAESFPGFDGENHEDYHNYRWFKLNTIDDVNTLNEVFPEADLNTIDIGSWVGIEYDLDYNFVRVSYLDSCISYARNLLSKLGYEVEIKQKKAVSIQTAMELINDFTQKEYESDADFSDLSRISVAYTTTEDEKHEIQAYIDLVNFKIYTTVDKDIVSVENYGSLDKMIEALEALDFIEMTSYPDPEDFEFEVIEVASKKALFSNDRIPEYIVPEGWSKYDLRGGDDNSFCTIERRVGVNHSGSIILPGSIDLGENGYIELDEDSSPNFLGFTMTIPEFEESLNEEQQDESEDKSEDNKVSEIIKSLSSQEKDELYRQLWSEHIKEDVETHLEGKGLDLPDSVIDNISKRYVYDGDYDCNRSYWDNIENLVEKEMAAIGEAS